MDAPELAPEWADYNTKAADMWPNASTEESGWEHRDADESPLNPENA